MLKPEMTNLLKQFSTEHMVVLGLMAIAGGRAHAGPIVYVTTDDDRGSTTFLGTLDLSTGQFTQVASTSLFAQSLTSSANGTLYAGASNGNLYTVNTSSGATTQFGTISAPVPTGGNSGQLSGSGLPRGSERVLCRQH